MGNALEPRLLDRETAAAYLSVSVDTLDDFSKVARFTWSGYQCRGIGTRASASADPRAAFSWTDMSSTRSLKRAARCYSEGSGRLFKQP
jgi:hypothetical protein